MISETPMNIEHCDNMDTESSDQTNEDVLVTENSGVPETSVEEPLPVCHRNSESSEIPVEESRNLTDASAIKQDLPPIGSPDHPEILHEVCIMICAANKFAARKRIAQFPNSKMIGAHRSDKKHHFGFTTLVNDEYISKLKMNINKFEDLLHFNINSEDFHPDHDESQHCQECKSSGTYAKWLEEQTVSD